jgi:hypothetical protein
MVAFLVAVQPLQLQGHILDPLPGIKGHPPCGGLVLPSGFTLYASQIEY